MKKSKTVGSLTGAAKREMESDAIDGIKEHLKERMRELRAAKRIVKRLEKDIARVKAMSLSDAIEESMFDV